MRVSVFRSPLVSWTTQADACSQLLSELVRTAASPNLERFEQARRHWIFEFLEHAVDRQHSAALQLLTANAFESFELRAAAARALRRLEREGISLVPVLNSWSANGNEEDSRELATLLQRVVTREENDAAQPAIERATRKQLGSLLLSCGVPETSTFVEHALLRFFDERTAEDDEHTWSVVEQTLAARSTREWLARWMSCTSTEVIVERMQFLRPEHCALFVELKADLLPVALERLWLPHENLEAHLGKAQLQVRIERAVEKMAASLRSSQLIPAPLDWDGARRLLSDYPPARSLLLRLLCDLKLEIPIRSRLLAALWTRDRPTAVRWAKAASRFSENAELLDELAEYCALALEPLAERLLRGALARSGSERLRYWALDALATLGQSEESWPAVLRELTDDAHPRIALRAHAALCALGEASSTAFLEDVARRSASEIAREEALLWLAEAAASEHVALFLEVFQNGSGRLRMVAASALARAGTTEAKTALLRRGEYRALAHASGVISSEGAGVANCGACKRCTWRDARWDWNDSWPA